MYDKAFILAPFFRMWNTYTAQHAFVFFDCSATSAESDDDDEHPNAYEGICCVHDKRAIEAGDDRIHLLEETDWSIEFIAEDEVETHCYQGGTWQLKQWKRNVNSLWPSDAIWQQRSGSTLAQVMACCLTAPSHYLNQCWLIISKVQYIYIRAVSQEMR